MSTVIKAGQRMSSTAPVTFNLDDVMRQGEQYLESIRAQAVQILTDARHQADKVRSAAEEQGRLAAIDAAHRQLDAKIGRQLESLWPALRETLAGIEQARQACLSHWESRAVHVAAAIAGRVIRKELTRDPEIPLALVREALEMAAGSPQVRIRLNPEDHAALAGQVQRLIAELSRLGTAEVAPDPAISRGGCRVETRYGVIDQQFETQLARIEEELR